jgi:hypothetical protein
MKKMYRVGYRLPGDIEEVEVTSETRKSVTFMSAGSQWQRRKHSAWENYFDSWKEAHDHLLEKAEGAVHQARLALDRAKGILGNVKGMKPTRQDFNGGVAHTVRVELAKRKVKR